MEALGQLSVADRIEAEIQAKVAEFLGMKSKLVRLRNHPGVQVRSKAEGLYAVQGQLENELKQALATIDKIKTGAWTYSDVALLTDFSLRLSNHMNNVRNLEREAGGTTVPEQAGMMQWGIPLLALAAFAFVTYMGGGSGRSE